MVLDCEIEFSLPSTLLCAGTHIRLTLFELDRLFRELRYSIISSDVKQWPLNAFRQAYIYVSEWLFGRGVFFIQFLSIFATLVVALEKSSLPTLLWIYNCDKLYVTLVCIRQSE